MKRVALLILLSAFCISTHAGIEATFGIQSLTWVDPDSDMDVRLLKLTDTLYFTNGFNVRANTFGEVGSVYFEFAANYKRTENQQPFTLAGDANGDYQPYYPAIEAGKHYTLIVTPYTGKNRTGQKGTPLQLDLVWLNSTETASVDALILVDAILDQNIRTLKDHDTLYTGEALNIVAYVSGAVNSVRFQLNTMFDRTENYEPYVMTGSAYFDYANWYPAPGAYTLTVTPYAGRDASGGAGVALTIHFVVLDEDQTNNPCKDLLKLAFENSLNGEQGEIPLTGTGVRFVPGKNGQGAYLDGISDLRFVAEDNLNPKRGSLEFWVNPNGQWQVNESYTFLAREGVVTTRVYGDYLFGKDNNNNLVGIFNRYELGNEPVILVSYNIDHLDLNTWHYIVYTWGNGSMQLYVDGVLVDQEFTSGNPFPQAWGYFRIGYDEHIADGDPLNASLDNLITTNCIKTSQEIAASYQEQRISRRKSTIDSYFGLSMIYPNPVENYVTISSEYLEEGTILEIQNANGILVKREQFTFIQDEIRIDATNLSAGMYYVILKNKNKTLYSKFIKK